MSKTIAIAHDFICPWCYVGVLQAEKLKQEFDVEFDWVGYELMPEELVWSESAPVHEIPNKPPTPSRFDLMLAAEQMHLPEVERPKRMRSHLAHLASEFAKEQGKGESYILELYRALWERGEFINEIEFLVQVGEKLGLDPVALRASIESEEFADRITHFDAPAYRTGVFNVPTFYIGDARYAEQPYRVLQKAVSEAVEPRA